MTSIVKRGRLLTNEDEIFSHNAWDDTEWTKEMYLEAEKKLDEQRDASLFSEEKLNQIEEEANKKWDKFYLMHGDRFFKDRKWIFSEFGEILEKLKESSPPCNILEIGCGVGNAVAEIINSNRNPSLHIYCCDISKSAIEILNDRHIFEPHRTRITAFQADVCQEFESKLSGKILPNSIDFITLIFTMSAFKPELMESTLKNLETLLKPGGLILFRDYARYDLTQLRFKGKSYLRENYYVRADGTTSYFFTKQKLSEIFSKAGLIEIELKSDNRMLINRLKALKMCRCWLQAKYRKM